MNDFYCFTMDYREWRVMDRLLVGWVSRVYRYSAWQASQMSSSINKCIYGLKHFQSIKSSSWFLYFFIIIFFFSLAILHTHTSHVIISWSSYCFIPLTTNHPPPSSPSILHKNILMSRCFILFSFFIHIVIKRREQKNRNFIYIILIYYIYNITQTGSQSGPYILIDIN